MKLSFLLKLFCLRKKLSIVGSNTHSNDKAAVHSGSEGDGVACTVLLFLVEIGLVFSVPNPSLCSLCEASRPIDKVQDRKECIGWMPGH